MPMPNSKSSLGHYVDSSNKLIKTIIMHEDLKVQHTLLPAASYEEPIMAYGKWFMSNYVLKF